MHSMTSTSVHDVHYGFSNPLGAYIFTTLEVACDQWNSPCL